MADKTEELKHAMWHFMDSVGNVEREERKARIGALANQRIFDNYVRIGNSAVGYLQSVRSRQMLTYYFQVGEREQIWVPLQVNGMPVPRIKNARTEGLERIAAWNGLQDAMYGQHAPFQSPEEARPINTQLRGLLFMVGATNFQSVR